MTTSQETCLQSWKATAGECREASLCYVARDTIPAMKPNRPDGQAMVLMGDAQ